MKLDRMGIKNQVLLMVIGCSVVTLLLVGGIALYGMFGIKYSAVQTSFDIGKSAEQNSTEALERSTKETMQILVHERGKQIDGIFNRIAWNVQMLANEMNTILSNPNDYAPRRVYPPSPANAGIDVPQLQYASEAAMHDPQLQREIGLTANLQDWLMRVKLDNSRVGATYITSDNGFTIVVDGDSEKKPLIIDFTNRPWYENAKREDKLIFTDVFKDFIGRGLVVTCAAPYHDANGKFAGVIGEGFFLTDINEIVLSTKVGETGFGFIINKEGKVMFSPQDAVSELTVDSDDDPSLFLSDEPSLAAVSRHMAAGETGIDSVIVDGKLCYIAYAPLNATNWSFGVVMEIAEVIKPVVENQKMIENSTNQMVDSLNDSVSSTFFAMLIASLAFIFSMPFLGRNIAQRFVSPIQKLTDGVREIASGNLDKKLDIHTGNEIEHLASCFNGMTDELKRYMENLTKVTADKERIATELNVATNIQASMLPRDFDFDRADFEIYATMTPAKEVGGDFYDFYLLDENHLMITIADVSGKGVPAALFMMTAKTILKNFAMTMTNPDDLEAVMTLANQQLCENNDEMMFVTTFIGMLNLNTGEFVYVNGGHNPPLICHDGKFSYVEVPKSFVVGVNKFAKFKQLKLDLSAGDMIFLYTDGVTEAMNEAGEQYTPEHLEKILNTEDTTEPLTTLLEDMQKSIKKHAGNAEQSDDITMLAVRYTGRVDSE